MQREASCAGVEVFLYGLWASESFGISVWSPGASELFGQEIISEEDIHAGIVLPESKAPEIGGTSSSWHRL